MIVLTVTYNDPGISWGPAVHFLELWNEAAQLGNDLEIVGYAPSWTGKRPIVEPKFDLRIVKVPNIGAIRQLVWDFVIALHILRIRPDVVYIRSSAFHLFSLAALAVVSTPVALEINGSARHDNISSGSGRLRRKIVELGESLLLKRASVVFSVTERLREYCSSVNPRALHIHVDNGVAREFFAAKRDSRPGVRFIYVGTFTPWDGAEKIVDIARRRPDLSFLMVGDGGRKGELERQAPDNIEFRGWVDYARLPEEYAQCNAGIVLYEVERHRHTSLSSLKTREYLAAGLPIFSTRVQGQEFIEEEGYGLLSSGDLERDIQTFVERHSQYRRALAAAAPDLFNRHSWASVASTTVRCLKQIVGRQPAERREHRIST
ncbi:MAG: hypothetical protein QOG72_2566 [Sphingomonadales bacterium]|jgi:glycosyltransferase involved in cell wall biosynthesis|nr:hypothetical protein [Sphingomonadales bacterium]